MGVTINWDKIIVNAITEYGHKTYLDYNYDEYKELDRNKKFRYWLPDYTPDNHKALLDTASYMFKRLFVYSKTIKTLSGGFVIRDIIGINEYIADVLCCPQVTVEDINKHFTRKLKSKIRIYEALKKENRLKINVYNRSFSKILTDIKMNNFINDSGKRPIYYKLQRDILYRVSNRYFLWIDENLDKNYFHTCDVTLLD